MIEEQFEDEEINLFSDIDNENDQYINAIEALELLAYRTKNDIPNISRRLMLDNFNYSVRSYQQTRLGVIGGCDTNYNYVDVAFTNVEIESNKSFRVTTDILNKALENFKCEETDYNKQYDKSYYESFYWLKSDFYNFPRIKNLGVTEQYHKQKLRIESEEGMYDFIKKQETLEAQEEAIHKAQVVSKKFFQEVKEFEFTKKLKPLMSNDEYNKFDEILKENKKLKAELTQAQAKIEELESKLATEQAEIQTRELESKLSPREENNIIKILAVLADMEKKVDISKPYEAHGTMLKKAQLLGIEPFPSDESIKKWFSKANEYKKS